MTRKGSIFLAAVSATISGAASAHPGHGTDSAMGLWEGLVHLLTQPDHLALLAGVAVGVAWWVKRRRARR